MPNGDIAHGHHRLTYWAAAGGLITGLLLGTSAVLMLVQGAVPTHRNSSDPTWFELLDGLRSGRGICPSVENAALSVCDGCSGSLCEQEGQEECQAVVNLTAPAE